uniref:(California timema) hypothetical protein n=1 Tax=Timema californicum TaxID=61474 RepID=A0A7R9IZR4_TIMCA|nr:unnamed protein product [Timema californicum]
MKNHLGKTTPSSPDRDSNLDLPVLSSLSSTRQAWPDYDVDRGALFIQHKFALRNRNSSRALYPHFTTATDTSNIQVVFQAVMDTVVRDNLHQVTLLSRFASVVSERFPSPAIFVSFTLVDSVSILPLVST